MDSLNNPDLPLISGRSLPIFETLNNCPSKFTDFAKCSCINNIYTRETMGIFFRQMAVLYHTEHPDWMPLLELWIKSVEQSINATSNLYMLRKILNISFKVEGTQQHESDNKYYPSIFISHTIWTELHDILQVYLKGDKNSEFGILFCDLGRKVSPKEKRILEFLLFNENTTLIPRMLQRNTKFMQEQFTESHYFKTTSI